MAPNTRSRHVPVSTILLLLALLNVAMIVVYAIHLASREGHGMSGIAYLGLGIIASLVLGFLVPLAASGYPLPLKPHQMTFAHARGARCHHPASRAMPTQRGAMAGPLSPRGRVIEHLTDCRLRLT